MSDINVRFVKNVGWLATADHQSKDYGSQVIYAVGLTRKKCERKLRDAVDTYLSNYFYNGKKTTPR